MAKNLFRFTEDATPLLSEVIRNAQSSDISATEIGLSSYENKGGVSKLWNAGYERLKRRREDFRAVTGWVAGPLTATATWLACTYDQPIRHATGDFIARALGHELLYGARLDINFGAVAAVLTGVGTAAALTRSYWNSNRSENRITRQLRENQREASYNNPGDTSAPADKAVYKYAMKEARDRAADARKSLQRIITRRHKDKTHG
jgi:hypothetical protein